MQHVAQIIRNALIEIFEREGYDAEIETADAIVTTKALLNKNYQMVFEDNAIELSDNVITAEFLLNDDIDTIQVGDSITLNGKTYKFQEKLKEDTTICIWQLTEYDE